MASPTPGYRDLIGTPFRYGGRGPDAFDCYGLLVEMNRRAGVTLPDYVSPRNDQEIAQLIHQHMPVWAPCDLAPGVAIAVRIGRHVSHVAYAVSDTHLIHTWQRTGGVTVEPIALWASRIAGTYKFSP